jgi:hypothetical protein
MEILRNILGLRSTKKRRRHSRIASVADPCEMRVLPSAVQVQSAPYAIGFDNGKPTASDGWEYESSGGGRIEVVQGRLQMDDTPTGRGYALNNAILHINLLGRSGVSLQFDQINQGDEYHPMARAFTGIHHSDGVAVSVDGVNWFRVAEVHRTARRLTVDLDAVIQRYRVSYSSDVRISFRQYDNFFSGIDGRAFDNIRITAGSVDAQPVPYRQTFSGELPQADDGWTYYSSSDGRIQVAGSKLSMDDMHSGGNYSLNEAILHLNLAGRRNVRLQFDHFNEADERHEMPATFTDHHNSDGVAVSTDGNHWFRLMNLDQTVRRVVVDLDAVIRSHNLFYTDDVQIKFQQFDNYSSPVDGRTFDSISVTAGLVPESFVQTATWQGITVYQQDLETVAVVDLSITSLRSVIGNVSPQGRINRESVPELWNRSLASRPQEGDTPRVLINAVFFDLSLFATDISFGLKANGRTISLGHDISRHLEYIRMLKFSESSAAVTGWDPTAFDEPTPNIVTGLSPDFPGPHIRQQRTLVGYSSKLNRLYFLSDNAGDRTNLEAILLMQRFGAEQIIQLDGGGSTSLVINGKWQYGSRTIPHAIVVYERRREI